MKKKILCVFGILTILISVWMIGTGFRKETTAFVDDYTIAEDNSSMIIHVAVGSSIGHVRKTVINQDEEGYIRFRSRFNH